MPQSMLALLALMIFSMLSYGQHQRAIQIQQNIVRDEIMMMAEGLMLKRLSTLQRVDFDALGDQAGTQRDTISSTAGSGALAFSLTTAVEAVERNGAGEWVPDLAAPYDFKEVTVTIRGPVTSAAADRALLLPEGVHLTRIYARLSDQ